MIDMHGIAKLFNTDALKDKKNKSKSSGNRSLTKLLPEDLRFVHPVALLMEVMRYYREKINKDLVEILGERYMQKELTITRDELERIIIRIIFNVILEDPREVITECAKRVIMEYKF